MKGNDNWLYFKINITTSGDQGENTRVEWTNFIFLLYIDSHTHLCERNDFKLCMLSCIIIFFYHIFI